MVIRLFLVVNRQRSIFFSFNHFITFWLFSGNLKERKYIPKISIKNNLNNFSVGIEK